MKRKPKYPCPECGSIKIQRLLNEKYDSGNIFGFTHSDYRELPTWCCRNCNFRWNNYKKRINKL